MRINFVTILFIPYNSIHHHQKQIRPIFASLYRNSSIKFKPNVMRIYMILALENIMSTQKFTQVYIF